MRASTRIITLGLLPLLVVPVWMGGGAYAPWQGSFLWLCAWAWVLFFIQPETRGIPSRPQRLTNLLKDPVVWIGILFMGFLLIQHFNTGRVHVFDFETMKWTYSPPPVQWLPWSFSRDESMEMIRWFGPILTLMLLLRHTWNALNTRELLGLVCLNGFCNAMLAFAQQAMGLDKMYNIQRFGNDFFGSFGYPNHGAVFFILMFALALGLFLQELLSESSDRDIPTLCMATSWTLAFFLAANLSTSRAGILGAWLVLILGIFSLAIIAWPRSHPVQRIYGATFLGILFAGFIALFVLFAKPVHIQELKRATLTLNVAEEIDGRFFQIESAFHMWTDHLYYGVGGWGYRYLGAHYLPEDQWHLMMGVGKANVHNDWAQFLAEFGLVGFGLLFGVFLPKLIQIVSCLFKRPTHDESVWADPLRICTFWGLFMLLLDSQFDIPFRSPAVFMHGVLLLFVLSPHALSTSLWRPVIDWKRLQPPALRLKNQVRVIIPEDNPTP
jgi:O-antigen ligase